MKRTMGKLLAGCSKRPEHWTTVVEAACALLNKQPKAAKGLWTAPEYLAEGIVNPHDILLDNHVGSPAAATLRVLNEHADFLQETRENNTHCTCQLLY